MNLNQVVGVSSTSSTTLIIQALEPGQIKNTVHETKNHRNDDDQYHQTTSPGLAFSINMSESGSRSSPSERKKRRRRRSSAGIAGAAALATMAFIQYPGPGGVSKKPYGDKVINKYRKTISAKPFGVTQKPDAQMMLLYQHQERMRMTEGMKCLRGTAPSIIPLVSPPCSLPVSSGSCFCGSSSLLRKMNAITKTGSLFSSTVNSPSSLSTTKPRPSILRRKKTTTRMTTVGSTAIRSNVSSCLMICNDASSLSLSSCQSVTLIQNKRKGTSSTGANKDADVGTVAHTGAKGEIWADRMNSKERMLTHDDDNELYTAAVALLTCGGGQK